MDDLSAQRTLVKSPPELWAEISDTEALAKHLGEFGEIRITRLDPETTVAWEGDRIRGTVSLEPSGWGTKVTMAAELVAATPAPIAIAEPEVEVAEEPAEPEDIEEPTLTSEPEAVTEEPAAQPKAAVEEPAAEPEPVTEAPEPAAAPAPKVGFFARLFGRKAPEPVAVEPEPEPAPEPVAAERKPEPAPEPVAVAEPEPVAVVEPEPEPDAIVEPEPAPEPVVVPEPVDALDADGAQAILVAVLDDLGAAHHRPFSRG